MGNKHIYPYDMQSMRAVQSIDLYATFKSHVKDKEYLDKLRNTFPKALDEFKPQIVIYNAGTDILIGDSLGQMDISKDGVVERDYIVFDECFKRNIPVVMLLS